MSKEYQLAGVRMHYKMEVVHVCMMMRLALSTGMLYSFWSPAHTRNREKDVSVGD